MLKMSVNEFRKAAPTRMCGTYWNAWICVGRRLITGFTELICLTCANPTYEPVEEMDKTDWTEIDHRAGEIILEMRDHYVDTEKDKEKPEDYFKALFKFIEKKKEEK